jgi:plasmid stabilization system protein ParE
MRQFALLIDPRAAAEILAAKRWRLENLGRERARELEDALAKVLDRIQAFPESGSPDKIQGRWSKTRRRVIVGETGYILRYRLHLKAALIEVRSLRHEKQRPPTSS